MRNPCEEIGNGQDLRHLCSGCEDKDDIRDEALSILGFAPFDMTEEEEEELENLMNTTVYCKNCNL